jgi:hypothetical protein
MTDLDSWLGLKRPSLDLPHNDGNEEVNGVIVVKGGTTATLTSAELIQQMGGIWGHRQIATAFHSSKKCFTAIPQEE